MIFKVLILFSIGILATTAIKNYEGYKVYDVVPKSKDEVNILEEVQSIAIGEFWEDQFDVDHVVKIMVAPEQQKDFLYLLKAANIEVKEVIGDLQRAINDQLNPATSRNTDAFLSFSWDQYYDLEAIHSWLDKLAQAYPDVVRTVVMGNSYHNREIKGIIIDFHPEKENKNIGMLEGTLHAREWISAATVTFVIKEFLNSTDPEIRVLAEGFEWHIFPVVNPDGYSYTFTNHRMWRKNRNPEGAKDCGVNVDDDMSNGVDLNRNFNFVWMSVGASNDSCSNTYAGPSPSSEPETLSIMNYVMSLKQRGNLMYYIAFHSYTQLIVVPYSNLSSGGAVGRPSNYPDMFEIAIRGSDSLARRFGTTYRVGVSAEVMYPMSGTSFDWVKYAAEVPIVYLFELRDLGTYGFLLPANQIVPTAQELVDALVGMNKAAINLGYYERTDLSGDGEGEGEDDDEAGAASGVLYSSTVIMLGVLVAFFNF